MTQASACVGASTKNESAVVQSVDASTEVDTSTTYEVNTGAASGAVTAAGVGWAGSGLVTKRKGGTTWDHIASFAGNAALYTFRWKRQRKR